MKTNLFGFFALILVLSAAGSAFAASAPEALPGKVPGDVKPPAEPAKIVVSTPKDGFAAGSQALISVKLEPAQGVKINRYPKVRARVGEQTGVLTPANGEIGDAEPPPLDKMKSNYFDAIPPVEMTLSLDPAMTSGPHELDGKMVYFYCMPANGFCAPVKVGFKIPLTIK